MGDALCRSSVIISDAWDYVEFALAGLSIAAGNRSTHSDVGRGGGAPVDIVQQPLQYDVILFDVYEDTKWDGSVEQGTSTPYFERASAVRTLQDIHRLLRPAGLAVFYLHRDANMKRYYRNIVKVFGQGQVVVTMVSINACVFVAGKGAFAEDGEAYPLYRNHHYQEPQQEQQQQPMRHPCSFGDESVHRFAAWTRSYGALRGWDSFLRNGHAYVLECEYANAWLNE